jgi:hypothetical protein
MLDWMDVSSLSFNALLLLERVQIGWLPAWAALPRSDLAVALHANPAVAWFLRYKCPEIAPWLDALLLEAPERPSAEKVRASEVAVLRAMVDLIVYATDPAIYDAQPFLGWDSNELLSLADFSSCVVIDVGAGTGRLALTVAPLARVVYAVEPVAHLRSYLKQKAGRQGIENVFVVDGLITDIPFPASVADVTMSGHVYGDNPADECRELARVTRPGGMIILCPGVRDEDCYAHDFLVAQGFSWSRYEEPKDGMHRKYWKRVRQSPLLRL